MHTRTRWLWLWVRKEESRWKWQLWWIFTIEQLFFLFDFFVSHLFLFLMGLVCNWLCVHHFCSIMLEGKISTFVALSIVFATIFPIGEYNWIYASPLQCCCVIKWKVEYLDPFSFLERFPSVWAYKKKKARDIVFLHHINPFEI